MLRDRRLRRAHGLAVNLAIGPSCFVQCRGCYNNFGATAAKGDLVTRDEVKAFASYAVQLGVEQVTISGGDPLTHPEILDILRDLRTLGLYLKVDTVGTALLRDAAEVFYGSDTVRRIDIAELADTIDMIGFPLDGVTAATQEKFRYSRRTARATTDQPSLLDLPEASDRRRKAKSSDANVVADTPELVRRFADLHVQVCVNTVLHAQNARELRALALLIRELRPDLWQLFEYQPLGALGGRNGDRFRLTPTPQIPVTALTGGRQGRLFDVEARPFRDLAAIAEGLAGGSTHVQAKSNTERQKLYFLVNDAGEAWTPGRDGSPDPRPVGHITRDRERVLAALSQAVTASATADAG